MPVGERAARLDHDPSRLTVARVQGPDVVGEVIDDLAVADEQQVIPACQCTRHLVEERPHVLVAMPFAGRMWLGGGRPVER